MNDETKAELKAMMGPLWARFVDNCTKDTFSEKEIITEGRKVINFHGSIEAHRKMFMKAVEEFFR